MPSRTLCPVIIGREDEIAILDEALRASHRGDGRAVVFAGDASIGKTRLVDELARSAEAEGLPVLRGACAESDLQLPYLPFIHAIRTHARLNQVTEIALELPDPAGLPSAGPIDATQRRARFFEGVVGLLEGIAGDRGAVLIVEDLHWSDAGTRDLLDYVARSLPGSRLLIVVTYRADELERGHPLLPIVRGWSRSNLATTIELTPLGPDGIDAMLAATLGEHDAGLAVRLHRRCEGNPFVLEEILKAGGVELAETSLPATVRDAILRRVERLDPAHLAVLRAAAVLGDPIDDGILVDLLGEVVPEALEECARQQLVMAVPGAAYAWRHALTREAVYQDIPPTRRRSLHSELADFCDGRPGIDEIAICGHLAAAGRWEGAVPRCRAAASAATSFGAFDDAARLLELCLPHVDDGIERASILEELSELLMQCGRPDEGEAFARRAVELRDRHRDPAASAAARRTLALCLWQQARWAEAIILEDQAIAALDVLDPNPLLVAALARRASWATLGEGDLPAALRLVERAQRYADAHGFGADLYRADEGQVLVCSGRVDEGFAMMDEGWRTRLRPSGERGSDWREGKFMLHHAVAIRNLLGRTNESLAILANSPGWETGQDAADTSLAVVRIEALWAHGEVARAQRLLGTLDLARIERNVVPWAQSVRVDVMHAAGERVSAAALARTALPPHWQPISQLRAASLVRVLVEEGDIPAALELSRRLEPLGGYGIELRLPFIDAAVEADLAAGRIAEAARLAAEVVHARPDDPLRLRIEARMRLAGDGEAALELLRRAAEGFARRGHRQDEWHSRRLIARALRTLGQRRAAADELRRVSDDAAAANGGTSPVTASPLGLALSPRERDVALLVAQGYRNREIAERLFISERTVENHIHRVLERSGLRSRVDLAAHVTGLSGGLSGSAG